MNAPVVVRVGRHNTIGVSLGRDVSQLNPTSEIRKAKSTTSQLIATWTVNFATDGTDGDLVLTLDDAITAAIIHSSGWMDIKLIENGEPVSAFKEPIQVVFEGVVTA